MADCLKTLPVRRAVVLLSVLAGSVTPGCGRQAPAAPDPVASDRIAGAAPAAAALPAPTAEAAVKPSLSSFALIDGAFTVTTQAGDQVSGTYTGEAIQGRKTQTATLDMQVTGGSGVFAGASGSLTAYGTGAFTGEGSFELSFKGSVTTGTQGSMAVRASLQGNSSLSCSQNHLIAITQTATGLLNKQTVTAGLSHEVGNTGCGG